MDSQSLHDGARQRGLRWLVVSLTVAVLVLGLIGSGEIFNRAYLGMTARNLHVVHVEPGGPADAAGLLAGDTLTEVDGIPRHALVMARLRLRGARAGQTLELGVQRGDQTPRAVTLRGAAPPRSEVIWRFLMGFAGFGSLILGAFVAYRRPEKLTLVFFCITLAIAFFLREHPRITWPPLHYAHELVYSSFQWFLPAWLLHFFLLFPKEIASRRTQWLIYLPAICLTGVWQIVHGLGDPVRAVAREELHLTVSVVYFILYTAISLGLFIRAFRRAESAETRARLRVALWATGLGLAPTLGASIIAQLVESPPPSLRYSLLAWVLMPAGFAYAAFRHRVFDTEWVVKRSLVYTSLSALLIGIYVALVFGVGGFLNRLTGATNPLLVLVSIVAMALVAAPARSKLQAWVDRVVFRQHYDTREALRRFSHDLSRKLELGDVSQLLLTRVSELLDLESAALFVRNDAEQQWELSDALPEGGANNTRALSTRVGSIFENGVRSRRLSGALDGARVEGLSAADGAVLAAHGAEVVVPLRARDQLIGLMVLGHRRRHEWTHQEDLELLETLGEQAAIALQNSFLHEQALERQRIAAELEVAQGVQAHLVPRSEPTTPGVELAGASLPCHEIGGDVYDYVRLTGGRLGIAIGDVSGKGIPAALVMAGLQAAFRGEAERGRSPALVLGALNHRIATVSSESHRFACFFYGVLDADGHKFCYANAGLDPPCLIRRSGRVERLRRGGPVLGVLPAARFVEGVVTLAPGDTLVLFTDGLIEPGDHGDQDDEAQLVEFLVNHRQLPAPGLKAQVIARHRQRLGEAPPDDTTLIVARAL